MRGLVVQMTSNIIFLGTGGDSFVVSKQHRTSGGIVIQIEDDQFHLNPGPGALLTARSAGVNLRANTGVFVTQNSITHANDVNAVIDAMSYGGFDKKGVLAANKTLLEGAEDHHSFLHPFYKDCVERVIKLDSGKRIAINNVEVKTLKVKNSDPHAVGLKFITPDYTITYVGDTKYSTDLLTQYEKTDILILNVPYLSKEEGKDLLSKEDAIKMINIINPRLAIITHFGINFLKADPMYEIREIQRQTHVQIIAAKDGMVVNPMSYAVEQGQKTLYKYAQNEGIKVEEYYAEEAEVENLNEMIDETQTTLEADNNEQEPSPESSEIVQEQAEPEQLDNQGNDEVPHETASR